MKKTDRRTLYTKNVIKDAFLALSKTKTYSDITITEICRLAEISRSTFYLHYNNVHEVLSEVIDDALENVGDMMQQFSEQSNKSDSCRIPLCVAIRSQEKYHCIFTNDDLYSTIVGKISSSFYGDLYATLKEHSSLSDDEIETLSYFQLNGCLAVCRRGLKEGNDRWCAEKRLLDQFISGGLKAFEE